MSEAEYLARARVGWDSDLPTFHSTPTAAITTRLVDFVRDASAEQISAWRKDVPWLQQQFRAYLDAQPEAMRDWTVLEYELPREFRRPDVIVLKNGCVVVLELKGYLHPTQAALDQVASYARELYASFRRQLRIAIGKCGELAPCVTAGAGLQSRTSAYVLEFSPSLRKATQISRNLLNFWPFGLVWSPCLWTKNA